MNVIDKHSSLFLKKASTREKEKKSFIPLTQNSLKIKTKYALLRNLGGVALDSIEADDVENVCGNGEQSLLKSIRKTLTQLERKTRQLIVHSLEEDLVIIWRFVVVSLSVCLSVYLPISLSFSLSQTHHFLSLTLSNVFDVLRYRSQLG
jgi:hypothetical protein